MDDRSDHTGDPEKEAGDVESLASRLSGTKTSSGPQSPAEPAEPEPEPEPEAVEASEEGAEPAESQERPAATEVAGEKGPGEPEWPAEAEAEAGDLAEAGPEEPAKPEPEGGPEEPEEEWKEEDEDEADVAAEPRRKEIPSQVCLQQATAGKEEAAPDREAEREGQLAEEGEESEEKLVQGGLGKTEDELGDLDEAPELESCDWTEEVQKQQEQQLRAELLAQFRSLTAERERHQRYSIYLQHRILEALRKKGLDAAEVPEKGAEPEAPEKEQAYLRHLAMLEHLRKQESDDLRWYHRELDQLKRQCEEKLSRVEEEWRRLQALKKQVVMQAMGSCRMRGGRQAALREVGQIQALEDKKEKAISAVRLENVQLKQSLVHFENRLRAQEDLTEGLLLIDFEQLKTENQTLHEKVEERNEELLKLRSKVTNHVQIITHVKEKLHFVDTENACKKSELMEIEAQVALKRDILTKTKQARDSLRIDNIKLNQKCGLLGKEALLRDMEEVVDRTEELSQRLEALKHHHAGLILSCRGVKQKMREAKAFLPS
ncbi:PREDICTED: coiled-coil domain-containing protein 96 [Lipotes vexillifer]|uniref:Coiled-coil domain-containing protein 96 n=1 Tax=Lipotes vexillifer TaxID=118797 RepID=A0A340X5U2_LIPVE|nr:PREDICTED: coiled-coil domain-containing protein 96 [Lipotes vexillifer]